MAADPIFSGGNLRVRWNAWSGTTPWMDCEEVAVVGDFVSIATKERVVLLPGHIIRGRLEVEPRPAGSEEKGDSNGGR